MAKPTVKLTNDDYEIGVGFAVVSSKVIDSSTSGFYPYVEGHYQLGQNWKVLAHLKGGIAWQPLDQFFGENEFLDDSLLLLNIEERINVGGQVVGRLSSKLSTHAGVSYADLVNMPFYIPSGSDSSKFLITYDQGGTKRIRLHAGVEYMPSINAMYVASVEVNSYATSNLERPWHLPLYVFKVYSSHSIREKVTIGGSLLAMGGIKAPTTVDFGIEELKPIFDVSIDINFKVNSRISAFITTHNLLNREYERYLGYPVRGMTFKMGGQYRF